MTGVANDFSKRFDKEYISSIYCITMKKKQIIIFSIVASVLLTLVVGVDTVLYIAGYLTGLALSLTPLALGGVAVYGLYRFLRKHMKGNK